MKVRILGVAFFAVATAAATPVFAQRSIEGIDARFPWPKRDQSHNWRERGGGSLNSADSLRRGSSHLDDFLSADELPRRGVGSPHLDSLRRYDFRSADELPRRGLGSPLLPGAKAFGFSDDGEGTIRMFHGGGSIRIFHLDEPPGFGFSDDGRGSIRIFYLDEPQGFGFSDEILKGITADRPRSLNAIKKRKEFRRPATPATPHF
jgi:hypothetical protein